MKRHLHHIHIFILIGLLFLALILLLLNYQTEKFLATNPMIFGVSYSPRYAKELLLDPKVTFQNILQNLKVRHIRLSAYWDEIEPNQDQFDFQDLDWYIDQASQHKTQAILTIGYKLPRWPECRTPAWLDPKRHPVLPKAGYSFISGSLLRERQLNMLSAVINHYKNNPTISAFQLENEPILNFGDCPKVDREFLSREVRFVREKTKKPIMITDSGELRFWRTPMQLSDIFGTTLYRVVDTPWFGPFQYPLRPWFYRTKSALVRKFFAPQNQKTVISELQAEPWATESLIQIPIDEQIKRFSLDQFRETVTFARKTGFSEAYFWGAEWWYYLAAQGHPEYLEYAKTLF